MAARNLRFTRLFCILFLLLFISYHQAVAQKWEYSTDFEDPLLPGWNHTRDVFTSDGILVIEPKNFASFPGDFGNLDLTVNLRKLGTGEFVISSRTSEAGGYHLLVAMGSIHVQRETPDGIDELGSTPTDTPFEEWVEINITISEGNITAAINGEEVISVTDPNPLPPGGLAFEPLGELTLEIDDLFLESDGEAFAIAVEKPVTTALQDNSLKWIRTGGPIGGLGYDVRMHPNNPDILFVTDAFAGVFKSVDGGKNWVPSNQGITTRGGSSGDAIPIFCLTIDPNNPDIVWTGTQNTRGIFKSTDGGETWVEKVNGIIEREGITFRGITIDPHTSDIVYAAAEISSWVWANTDQPGREFDKTKGVVYKSTNGGESWQPIWRGDNLARYIIVDPRDSNVLYVSTGIFDREAANSDYTTNTAGGVGVLKSTDGGATWSQVNNGLTNLYIGTLFMNPENPNILLAGSGNNAYPEGAGVFLTVDGGETWDKVLNSGVQSVEFAVSNPGIAYAGEPGWIYRSEDGGRNWRVMNGNKPGWGPPGVEAGFPIDFQVDPRDPNRIFANNYGGGNFLSEDGGESWVVASAGYTGAQVRAIAVSPEEPAKVYVSARSGFFGTSDGGRNWTGLVLPQAGGLEWNAVAIDPTDPSHLLAANNWMAKIVESKNNGQRWSITDLSLPMMQGWRVIRFAPSDPNIVYAGSGAFYSAGVFDPNIQASGIYRSLDGGTTWHDANNDLTRNAHVTDLVVDPADPLRVMVASPTLGVLVTTDGGENWELFNGLLPQSRPQSVSIHPDDPEIIFVGMEFGGMYQSVDSGKTWRMVAAGVTPESSITSIVFDPSSPNTMYISQSSGGVYKSIDGGVSWVVINNGLRTRAVNAIAISNDGLHLYAATEGEGVFRLDINGLPPDPVINENAIEVQAEIPTEQAGQIEGKEKGEPPATSENPEQPVEETQTPIAVDEPDGENIDEPGNGKSVPCLGGLLPLVLFGMMRKPWIRNTRGK